MKKATLIIGPAGGGKTNKVKQLVGNRPTQYFTSTHEYITYKFPKGTEFIVFEEMDFLKSLQNQSFINKLAAYDDVMIKTPNTVEKVPMPHIIVTVQASIHDTIPNCFLNGRWLILHANYGHGHRSTIAK
jgi:ABC-type branched-subunit amino acid transport system ATPase component